MNDYRYVELATHYAGDFDKAFEVISPFLKGLEEGWITGLSFNKYVNPSGSYLRVRLNFTDFAKGRINAEKIIENLTKRKLIEGNSDWNNFGDLDTVKLALEAATKCAFTFREELKKTHLRETFDKSKVEFELQFESILLKKLSFPVEFQQYGLIGGLEQIASNCADKIKSDFESANLDFLERFFHHFRNCINISPEIEGPVIFRFVYHKILTDLARERRA